MSTMLAPAPRPSRSSATRNRSVALVLGVVLAAAALLSSAVALTVHVVADRTNAEARIQHHRGLALAAAPQLDRALQRALLRPVTDRAASPRPWQAGPQLGPGTPDASAQGAPTIETILVRSAPDAVVARMVIESDGFTTTLIDKWSDGGSSSDTCSYSDLPPPWSTANSAATCRDVVTSVPATGG
jgi:hypothetical protein